MRFKADFQHPVGLGTSHLHHHQPHPLSKYVETQRRQIIPLVKSKLNNLFLPVLRKSDVNKDGEMRCGSSLSSCSLLYSPQKAPSSPANTICIEVNGN